jgi:hypothetical protein
MFVFSLLNVLGRQFSTVNQMQYRYWRLCYDSEFISFHCCQLYRMVRMSKHCDGILVE